MELRNLHEAEEFKSVIDNCTGTVWVNDTVDGTRYNMKDEAAQSMTIGKMLSGQGDYLELFAEKRADESKLLNFLVARDFAA